MRNSVIKMLYSDVPMDRKIEKFPEPYRKDSTPYVSSDFSESTYKYCQNDNLLSNTLNICKIIVIGDSSVGKTCIINRFCQKIFDTNYKSTIGVDFEVVKFELLNIPLNLQIWDTAGQERFKCIAQSYYRGAHGILVVFDLSDMYSLQHAKSWLNEALDSCTTTTPFLFLVGTKRDLLRKYAYKHVEQSAIKVAKKLNAEYWPVSSKTGCNIDQLFYRVAALTFEDFVKREINNTDIFKRIGTDLVCLNKTKVTQKRERKCEGLKCGKN